MSDEAGRGPVRWLWRILVGGLVVAIAVLAVVLIAGGGTEKAKAQTVRFQTPTANGPDPFTAPADVQGPDRVRVQETQVGAGPFGGTGSDLVCDRELLIRSLRARPDRLREWARVAGIPQTEDVVARYIRSLRPVTLTRDTRVTNHSFVNGHAEPFQAILQAGTAVLVDKAGKPVARCRCGNPLRPPVFSRELTCYGCPPHYVPPPPCSPPSECYTPYPHPPGVTEMPPTTTPPTATTGTTGGPGTTETTTEPSHTTETSPPTPTEPSTTPSMPPDTSPSVTPSPETTPGSGPSG